MHKVSVIVVTYNRLPYLKLTIDSILKQTYQDFNIIIIGDGHQSDVENYVTKLGNDRISYKFVDHCGYPAKARNLGIKHSDSEYIAFCDDDDLWHESKLSKQLEIFDNDKDLVLCCTNRMIINSDGVISESKSLKRIPSKFDLRNLLISNYISYSSVVIKREILANSGIFVDDIVFKAVEDYHLWIRIALFGKIYFLNEKLVKYRIHEANISTKLSIGANKNIKVFKDLFKKYHVSFKNRLLALSVANMKLYFYLIRELQKGTHK